MAKKTSNTAGRIKKQKAKVIEFLAESGNVTYACKRAGISRETYYCWRGKDKSFLNKADGAVLKGKECVNDIAHNRLIHSIKEGHFPAIKFQLVNCHDDYHPKKTTSPYRIEEMTPPITIRSIPFMAKMLRYQEYLEKGGDPSSWKE